MALVAVIHVEGSLITKICIDIEENVGLLC